MPLLNNSLSLLNSFTEKQPTQTIDNMLDICGCSLRTIRRKIKVTGLMCSYNKNSTFYTVPNLTKFNRYGIWHHDTASFSKWGNLYKTIVQIIDRSEMGFTSGELKSVLKIRVYDPLRILYQKNQIEKIEIQSQNVYFSTKAAIKQNQISKRELYVKQDSFELPEAEIIIAILVEIISNKLPTPRKIYNRLLKKGTTIGLVDIENVIDYYELKKKLSTKSAKRFDQ